MTRHEAAQRYTTGNLLAQPALAAYYDCNWTEAGRALDVLNTLADFASFLRPASTPAPWLVTFNVSGYLPEGEPSEFEHWRDAVAEARQLVREAAGGAWARAEGRFDSFLADLKADAGSERPFDFRDAGWVYSVSRAID